MNQFQNPFINNMNYMGANQGLNQADFVNKDNKKGCGCQKQDPNIGCCPTIYQECPPIVTCSKQVLNQYHIVKQPYVHNYHTEVVHHHILQKEFIPQYTCSEVHVNDPDNTFPPRR